MEVVDPLKRRVVFVTPNSPMRRGLKYCSRIHLNINS